MRVDVTEDLDVWAKNVGDWLAERPVERNLLLSLIEEPSGRFGDNDPLYAWVQDGDRVVGASRALAPFPMTLSDMSDEAADALCEGLHEREVELPGVNGPAASAARAAARWTELTGSNHTLARQSQLLRLDEVKTTAELPGVLRPAEPDDADVLVEWFSVAVGGSLSKDQAREHARRTVDQQTAAGRLLVWENPTLAGAVGWAQPVGRVARPRPIYVHPDHRGRGSGKALVAAAVRRAMADGADCCMCYSDLAYEEMTKVLRQVGFGYVDDIVEYRFE